MDLSRMLSAPSPEPQPEPVPEVAMQTVSYASHSPSTTSRQSRSRSPQPPHPPPASTSQHLLSQPAQTPDVFENQLIQVFFGGSSRTFEKMKLWRDTAAELRRGVPAAEAFHRQISYATSYLRSYYAKVEDFPDEHDASLCMQACRGQPHRHGYVCRFCGQLVSSDLHQLKYGPCSRHFVNKKCTLQGEDLKLFLAALGTVDQKFMETNSKAEGRHAQRQAVSLAASRSNAGGGNASGRGAGPTRGSSDSPSSSRLTRSKSRRSTGSDESSDTSPRSSQATTSTSSRYQPFPRLARPGSAPSVRQLSYIPPAVHPHQQPDPGYSRSAMQNHQPVYAPTHQQQWQQQQQHHQQRYHYPPSGMLQPGQARPPLPLHHTTAPPPFHPPPPSLYAQNYYHPPGYNPAPSHSHPFMPTTQPRTQSPIPDSEHPEPVVKEEPVEEESSEGGIGREEYEKRRLYEQVNRVRAQQVQSPTQPSPADAAERPYGMTRQSTW